MPLAKTFGHICVISNYFMFICQTITSIGNSQHAFPLNLSRCLNIREQNIFYEILIKKLFPLL